jgi:hypothetical protein
MKSEIVKVQLTISTNTDPMILVYNRGRTRECLIEQTKENAAVFNNELKSFWWAVWDPIMEAYTIFVKPADWQTW